MSNVVEFVPLAPQPSLDEVMAAYPRQEGVYWLKRAYASGMLPVPLASLLAAFQRYAAHCRRMNIEWQYIKTVQKYVELHCWEDVYPEKQACGGSGPLEDAAARRERLRASAAKGNRFSADLLKRDYNE